MINVMGLTATTCIERLEKSASSFEGDDNEQA
jgi:hypothetical protein